KPFIGRSKELDALARAAGQKGGTVLKQLVVVQQIAGRFAGKDRAVVLLRKRGAAINKHSASGRESARMGVGGRHVGADRKHARRRAVALERFGQQFFGKILDRV